MLTTTCHINLNKQHTGKLDNGVCMTMTTNLEIAPNDKRTFRYGTIACGADTYSGIWTKGTQVFSCDDRLRSKANNHHSNLFRTSWKKYDCLDLLVVNDQQMGKSHRKWMDTWGHIDRAKCILVFHGNHSLVAHNGIGFQKWCKQMRKRGYDIRTWHLNATDCGAAIWSSHTISFCFPAVTEHHVPTQLISDISTNTRPCQNVMRLYGIPKWKYYPKESMTPYKHPRFHNVIGKFKGGLVYHWDGPAGDDSQINWVYIPGKGIRRIIIEEISQLKGLTNTRYDNVTLPILDTSIEQHVWATLGDIIQPFMLQVQASKRDPRPLPPVYKSSGTTIPKTPVNENDLWRWEPPDLSIGSDFYKQRLTSLRLAVDSLGKGCEHHYQQGINILSRHRQNYGSEGPKSLTVLWWEWPEVHWTELRDGASMNFMETPTPKLCPNQELKGEALKEAIKFTDELVELGVIREAVPKDKVVNNFPIFLVEKPHVEKEKSYRCIADGKAGGQNDVCVGDPCQMTSPDHILPHLYKNGWSGVVDASKYFHMFLTREDEQRFLGLIHPGNNKMYLYNTLPMGTRNSPGASGRFGAAFLRHVIDKFPIFQGTPIDNSTMAYFTKKVYHPEHGEGRVLVDCNGVPVVLLWIHVDDILIHGPTQEKLRKALTILLDATVELGLICQSNKTVPPTQKIKFCGFIYNTEHIPQLIIPDNKISRAIAMIDYLTHGCAHGFARLVVSMVVGFLQSLVPATPGNIGASFLQPIYEDLHKLQANDCPGTKQFYFCAMKLSQRSQDSLWWWRQALILGLSKQTQPQDFATVGLSWGDGSGTGTGGTINFLDLNKHNEPIRLDVWMGTWSGTVVQSTSNWKEMCTLKQTLQNEMNNGQKRVQHRRLIYCTDNMVMCDIFRKGVSKSDSLQKLFLEVKLLEIQLECHLLLIHVPGTTMIREGTDGLSRGVPLQSLYEYEGNSLLPLLWRAATPSHHLLQWALQTISIPWESNSTWIYQSDYTDWSRSNLIGHNVLWCVTPGFGKQAILQGLYSWSETPTCCGHIFIIPRIMQREFGRVSKFVVFSGQYTDLPLPFVPLVPFVLMYVPPFNRYNEHQINREKQRLDVSSPHPIPSWIKKDIDRLQRVSLPL